MKVFVTGASGYIGNAVACAFRRAGHEVYGLVRSEASAHLLRSQEIVPIMSDLGDLGRHVAFLETLQVYVHCGFEPSQLGVEKDSLAVKTFLHLGKNNSYPKTFLYTSGIWVQGNSEAVLDESAPCNPISLIAWRLESEHKVLHAATGNFHTVVIRPGVVFGGAGGITALWFQEAVKGALEILGDGSNYWPMIHRDDLAQLYLLCAEKELSGLVLNATDGTLYTVKEMVESLAKVTKSKLISITQKQAQEKLGPMWEGLAVNQKISSERARRLLGWHPRFAPFSQEVLRYYQSWKASQEELIS